MLSLLCIYLAGCGFDVFLTSKRMKAFGPTVEMTPHVRWAFEHGGLAGVAAAILVPAMGVFGASYFAFGGLGASFVTGMRTMFALAQLRTMRS